jgi:ribosomal protein S1
MATGYVRHPSEIAKVGDEIEVRILEIDKRKRRIDLSLMGINEMDEEDVEEEPAMTAMEIALQRAQTQPQEPESDDEAKRSRPDLSEQEDILARTLKMHSQSQGRAE